MIYRKTRADIEDLKRRFIEALPSDHDSALRDKVFEGLEVKHSEGHRSYHNLGHLVELFEYFDQYAEKIQDKRALTLAILFHDIFYDIAEKDNEHKSAEHAKEVLTTLGVDAAVVERVAELIEMTKRHDCPPGDMDAAYFMDMDMAVLGIPLRDYKRYSDAIGEEYCTHYAVRQYHRGRIELFLYPVSVKERIFITDEFEARCGQQAKDNLNWEIGHIMTLMMNSPEPMPFL